MKRLVALSITCSLVAGFNAYSGQYKFGDQTLTVPDDFEIELVAGTNLVQRPVSMDFDEQGRLYVTDSSGSNEKVAQQLEQKPHRVLRLEDGDGDGKFDKSIVYADKMMFPEGAMWLDGSLYVSAPPSIWKLTDTDGDGVADKREEWHQGKTLTGCANDLHGPYLGPDGWIYWCKGAFAEQTYEVNGKPFTTKAAHIFRAHPDHSGLEPVMTGGMDNPVGIAFSPEGERFLAGTFFEPSNGLRDGVIHAIYGGVYGKPHPDVLDPFKKTGDLMPVMIHLGPAASCSVINYKSQVFGADYQNNLFVCNFNLHNITRHILTPDGATFKTKDSVFLSSDSTDFHPTCVLEDADGSLLVIDTGGWYKICCPTSQLYKPDMLGAIYRIHRKGTPKIEDARGLKIDWAKATPNELIKLLDDSRPYVVAKAIHQVVVLKAATLPSLADMVDAMAARQKTPTISETAQRNAIWALMQIDDPKAREAITKALPLGGSVAQTALYAISLSRDGHALETSHSFAGPRGQNSAIARIAAEALGRSATSQNKNDAVGHLMGIASAAQALATDRNLEHSIIYALIEIDNPAATAHALTSVYTQKIALIALDQMDNGGLKPEQVTPFLLSTNADLKQAASWVVSHHPEWGDALAGFFAKELNKDDMSGDELKELEKQLADTASNATIQNLLANSLASRSPDTRHIALRAIEQSGMKNASATLAANLSKLLSSKDAAEQREAIATAHSIGFEKRPSELVDALMHIANNASSAVDLRLNALAAIRGQLTLDAALFGFVRAHVDASKPVALRGAATGILGRSKLDNDQLLSVVDSMKTAGPLEVTKLLAVFEHSTNEALGLKLVETLKTSKALSSLRGDTLKQHLGKYPASVQAKLDELIASINVDAGKQKAHIDELLAGLAGGDIRRGQAVFNSPKVACSSCHRIGFHGGHVGPDLTRIGQVRTERDLLESIVYPSASFVRSFEPMIVTTKSDEVYTGIVKKDAADEVVLVTGPNAESHISRSDIVEMRPGTVSVMPQGLDAQMSKQELADLVTFLKATRW